MELRLLAFAGCWRLSMISSVKIEMRSDFCIHFGKAEPSRAVIFASSSDQRSVFFVGRTKVRCHHKFNSSKDQGIFFQKK